MHIVTLGNCQVQTIGEIIRRFVAPYEAISLDFVDAYHNVTGASYERLRRADIVIGQATLQPPPLDHSHIPAGTAVYKIPLVSGAFLWPYHGVAHPLAPTVRYGNPPYMPENSDRFLAKLILASITPAEALAQYKPFDVAKATSVDRLYEITLDQQRRIDEACGYDCASIIEAQLPSEALFQSAFHFGARIARHIAVRVCERIKFDPKYGQRIEAHLHEAPFVPRHVPVHPSIARHFGMSWVKETTTYPFLWEGEFTFDEYVLRFMEAKWSPALQEGVIDARNGEAGAKAKLLQGLIEAPRSAVGHHELSRIVEREGDLEEAIRLQFRAADLQKSASISMRLGNILRRVGDDVGAVKAFRAATQVDGANAAAWARLRDTLIELDKLPQALKAAQKAMEFSTDAPSANRIVEKIHKQIANKRRKI